MENKQWGTYIEQTKEKPPRPLLVKAFQYIENKNQALDVGSGALNDSKFLLKEGFAHVAAIDQAPVAQEIAESLPVNKFDYKISRIEDLNLPSETYDLINAQLSLPFIHPTQFRETFSKLLSALKKGGVFTGQFFGNNDEWNVNNEMTFVTKEQALEFLAELELLYFKETEENSKTAAGTMKHWHIFDFIVKK